MTDLPDLAPYKHAVLDWVVAHGSPMGVFGPSGRIEAERVRAVLAVTGIDYDLSELGDMGGQSWSEDTFDGPMDHPGVWALVVAPGEKPDRWGNNDQTWFVPGENLALGDVILGVLEAGQVGDLYWRIKVAEAAEHD